jgi:vacuolar iron transporter family protein
VVDFGHDAARHAQAMIAEASHAVRYSDRPDVELKQPSEGGAVPDSNAAHLGEPHETGLGGKLNVLRAGVLGAQDGIISTAGLVIGVAGASVNSSVLLIAGLAGLVSGALSMAGGEYVSVSAQKDTEVAIVEKERWELHTMPERELTELAQLYEEKGLTPDLARQVAVELHKHDALAAHAETELGLDPTERANPWSAAITSAISFALGAMLPLLAITLSPAVIRIPVTFVVVIVALVATGYVSARLGGAPKLRAVLRNVGIGVLAMIVTYGIGAVVGTAI